jgi:hypothetical protein
LGSVAAVDKAQKKGGSLPPHSTVAFATGPADAAANGFGNPFYVGGGGLRDSAGEFNYETLEKARK